MGRLALLVAVALALAGCAQDAGGAASERPGEITISAAASLSSAFEAYAQRTPAKERFSFAGSGALAAQIRQGARPDLYAAADTQLPRALHAEGRVAEPTVFATNTLVIAVPADSTIASIDDLTAPGVDLVIGAEDVPLGDYARTVLERLPPARRAAILANVRSREPDANSLVAKVTQGAADAAFAYRSDVAAASGRLRAIELADELQPAIAYAVAVVEGADNPGGARAFIDGLLSGDGARGLERAGLGAPPGR